MSLMTDSFKNLACGFVYGWWLKHMESTWAVTLLIN